MPAAAKDPLLAPEEVVPFLLRHGLVDGRQIVDDGIAVDDTSRRNRNYRISAAGTPLFIVKQGAYAETANTVEHEANIYQRLQGEPEFAPFLPACRLYDAQRKILVLEHVQNAIDVRAFHRKHRGFSRRGARAIGTALGTLHRVTAGDTGESRPPWAFTLHRPAERFMKLTSAANVRLIGILQRFPEFQSLLDGAAAQWTPSALIHNDVKWDNLLIDDSARDIRIVDWELAGTGDPMWDAGSVFSDYLVWWLSSVPIAGEAPPERFLQLTRCPLERMQPAIRAYWDAYAAAGRIDDRQHQMRKAVAFGAVRLLQSAYEQLQVATEITGNAVCMLQLSWNMLRQPAEAAAQLLGLDVERETAAA